MKAVRMSVGESWDNPKILVDWDQHGGLTLHSRKAQRRLKKLESMLTAKQWIEIDAELCNRKYEDREP